MLNVEGQLVKTAAHNLLPYAYGCSEKNTQIRDLERDRW